MRARFVLIAGGFACRTAFDAALGCLASSLETLHGAGVPTHSSAVWIERRIVDGLLDKVQRRMCKEGDKQKVEIRVYQVVCFYKAIAKVGFQFNVSYGEAFANSGALSWLMGVVMSPMKRKIVRIDTFGLIFESVGDIMLSLMLLEQNHGCINVETMTNAMAMLRRINLFRDFKIQKSQHESLKRMLFFCSSKFMYTWASLLTAEFTSGLVRTEGEEWAFFVKGNLEGVTKRMR